MANEKTFTLTMDGKELTVTPGKTILQVARDNGIEIPTLCYDPRLVPYGSCLLCVVEVEKDGKSRTALSCATEAQEGMNIQTRNEKVYKARKNALDMLLSNHFADCRGACYENCPANVDVQGYLALANAGRYLEALELIRRTNPFPLVCGRVCVRYCEASCRRNDLDSPVAVNFVKRYVADLEYDRLEKPARPQPNGKRVAIVGGGPSGLTAAFFLARQGYAVKLLDAHPKLGGMLRYGIPDYRLPSDVLDREIQYILDHGVEVVLNSRLGKDFSLGDLKNQGFDAIFLALGSQKAKKMRIKDEETPGVMGGINFLERVKKEGPPDMHGHVLVVGGGNTAIDAARTALRCKADQVSILYRRTRDEMPADAVEIRDAEEEGVKIEFLVAPLGVVTEGGNLKALRCQRMELGAPDASGRRSPVPVEGSEFDMECTSIIAAIGQDSDIDALKADDLGKVEITRWNTIQVDAQTFATSIEGVFAGGDVVTGPAAAIDAIGAGRRAAEVIDGYVMNGYIRPASGEFLSKKSNLSDLPSDFFDVFEKSERAVMMQEDAHGRIHTFDEVDRGVSQEGMLAETARCLVCGCSDVFTCKLKEYAGEYGAEQKRFAGKVKKYRVDNRHPYITIDPNKCILCGLCVRTCDMVLGVSALGFINRGFDMTIGPTLGKALQDTNCISCGNCIEVCPTGSLSFNLGARPGPWRTEPAESLCSFCGVGCRLVFNKANERAWTVTGKPDTPFQSGELCARGRFGHRYLLNGMRLKEARLKGGSGKPVKIEEAARRSLEGLKAVAAQHGAESLAFLVSPHASNEEIFLVRKLAHALGSPHVGSLYDLANSPDAALAGLLGLEGSTLPMKQVESADAIVLVNSDVTRENPVLGFRVRRAAERGAELISISSTELDVQDLVTLWLDARRGTASRLLAGVAGELARRGASGGIETASLPSLDEAAHQAGVDAGAAAHLADLLADAQKNVVFIYNGDLVVDRSAGDLKAIAGLLLMTGRIGKPFNGLLLTRMHSNSQGLRDLLGMDQLQAMRSALLEGKIRAVFSLGEDFAADPLFGKALVNAGFCVAMDILETETTLAADVVLPSSAPAESAGSMTSLERRVQAYTPAFTPPAGVSGFEILAGLTAAVCGISAPGLTEVRKEIAASQPRYALLEGLEGTGEFFAGGEVLSAAAPSGPLALDEEPRACVQPQHAYACTERLAAEQLTP